MSDDNRSLCGYFLRNANALDDFYAALSAYAWKCYGNTIRQGKARLRERENLQDRDKAPSALAGLSTNCFRQQPDRLRPAATPLRHHQRDYPGPGRLLRPHQRREPLPGAGQPRRRRQQLLPPPAGERSVQPAHRPCLLLPQLSGQQVPRAVLRHQPGKQFHYRRLRPLRLAAGIPPEPWSAPPRRIRRHRPAQGTQSGHRLPGRTAPDPQQMQYVHALAESQSGFDELGEHLPVHPAGRNPRWNSSSQVSARSTAPRRIATSSSKPTGASSPRSSTGAPICWAPTARGVEHSNVQDEAIRMALLLNYAAADRHGRVPVASLENAQRLLVQLGSACWEKPSAPSTWPARPSGPRAAALRRIRRPRLGRAHLHPQQLRSDR